VVIHHVDQSSCLGLVIGIRGNAEDGPGRSEGQHPGLGSTSAHDASVSVSVAVGPDLTICDRRFARREQAGAPSVNASIPAGIKGEAMECDVARHAVAPEVDETSEDHKVAGRCEALRHGCINDAIPVLLDRLTRR
jgi:hypothetical protein